MADSDIHMDDTKSAKAGTGRTRKKPRPATGAVQNTLSEQPNKGRSCRTGRGCVYFPLRTMPSRGGGLRGARSDVALEGLSPKKHATTD